MRADVPPAASTRGISHDVVLHLARVEGLGHEAPLQPKLFACSSSRGQASGGADERSARSVRVDGHLPLATTSAWSLHGSTTRHSCALTYLLRQLLNQFCRVLVRVGVLVQLHDRHSRGELL
jgi:hypothetical protein